MWLLVTYFYANSKVSGHGNYTVELKKNSKGDNELVKFLLKETADKNGFDPKDIIITNIVDLSKFKIKESEEK